MGLMKEIYLEMLNRDFQGTPQDFMLVWFKENNIENKKKKNAKKYIYKKNK